MENTINTIVSEPTQQQKCMAIENRVKSGIDFCGHAVKQINNNILRFIKDDCIICMENLFVDKKIAIIDCQHIFHEKCIEKWVTKSTMIEKYCPFCRESLQNITSYSTADKLLSIELSECVDKACFTSKQQQKITKHVDILLPARENNNNAIPANVIPAEAMNHIDTERLAPVRCPVRIANVILTATVTLVATHLYLNYRLSYM